MHHGLARLLQTGSSLATSEGSDLKKTKNILHLKTVICFLNAISVSPVNVLLLSISAEMFEHKFCPLMKLFLLLSPCQLFGWIGEKCKHQIVVFAVMALMAVQGVANLQAQWAIIGEFSNLPQEELLDWIQENTRPGE